MLTAHPDEKISIRWADYQKLEVELARLREIETAARTVYDGLNARLDDARERKAPMPVFNGIADLHDALNRKP